MCEHVKNSPDHLPQSAWQSEEEILCSASVGQKTSQPGARNAICVTLATNVDLSTTQAGDANRFVAFTLTGLTGFQTDGQSLTIRKTDGETHVGDAAGTDLDSGDVQNRFCLTSSSTTAGCAANENNQVKFTEETGEAEFYLSKGASGGMTAGTDYAFCFQVTNPKEKSECRDVSIKVKDASTSTANAVTFPVDLDSGSACPGVTTDRAFTTATVRSSSNVTAMSTGVFVELSPNYKIAASAVVTIAGLNGFMAVSQATAGDEAEIDVNVVSFSSKCRFDDRPACKLQLSDWVGEHCRSRMASAIRPHSVAKPRGTVPACSL